MEINLAEKSGALDHEVLSLIEGALSKGEEQHATPKLELN